MSGGPNTSYIRASLSISFQSPRASAGFFLRDQSLIRRSATKASSRVANRGWRISPTGRLMDVAPESSELMGTQAGANFVCVAGVDRPVRTLQHIH